MTKLDQINTRYDNGEFMVLINHRGMTAYRNRNDVRIINDRIEVRSGKRWLSALGCQIKFARNA